MAFDIGKSKSMGNIGKVADKTKDIGNQSINRDFQDISIQQLVKSEKNFYRVEDINDLAASIALYGILQPLLVEENPDDGTYKIIAGHRRFIAASQLGLKKVPCFIKQGLEDVDFELMLIHANKYRHKNDIERAKEIEQIERLIKQKKGEDPDSVQGKTMQVVADTLDLSLAQAKRLNNLNRLIPEIQQLVESGEITSSTAEKFSLLAEDSQKEIYNTILTNGVKISREEAEEVKKKYTISDEKHREDIKSLQNNIQELNDTNFALEKEITKYKDLEKKPNSDEESKQLKVKIKELEEKQKGLEKEKKENESKYEKKIREFSKAEETKKETVIDKDKIYSEIKRKALLKDMLSKITNIGDDLKECLSNKDDSLDDDDKILLDGLKKKLKELEIYFDK